MYFDREDGEYNDYIIDFTINDYDWEFSLYELVQENFFPSLIKAIVEAVKELLSSVEGFVRRLSITLHPPNNERNIFTQMVCGSIAQALNGGTYTIEKYDLYTYTIEQPSPE